MENDLILMTKPDQDQNLDQDLALDQELKQLLAPMRVKTASDLQLYRWQKAVKQEITHQQKPRAYGSWFSMIGCLIIGVMIGGSLFGKFFPQKVEVSQKAEGPIATCSFSDSSVLAKNLSSPAPNDVLYIKIR